MSEFNNNLRGVLFKNDRKRDGKQDPDYAGSCEISGVEYWLKAWINTSKKDGAKFMSLRFQAKEAKEAAQPAKSASAQMDEFEDADIPF